MGRNMLLVRNSNHQDFQNANYGLERAGKVPGIAFTSLP
jgi:hypothetical protein